MTDLPVQDTTRQLPGPDLFPQFKWNEQSIETLKGLLASGISGGLIAERMGITRSAVMGKASRLNLTVGAGKPIRMSQEDRQARKIVAQRQRRGTQPTHDAPVLTKAIGRPPYSAGLAEFNATIPLAQRVTIEGLTHTTCRWPCGDPATPDLFYCGALEANNMEGIPYCRVHRGFAYAGRPNAKPWLAGRP